MSDLISRQDAIDAVNAYLGLSSVSRTIQNMTSVQEILENLPSAYKTEPSRNNDCNGCKFVGYYDTDFPCCNCVRKTKDYYEKAGAQE